MVQTPGGRLDNIQRPNLAGYARDWVSVIPNDNPPLDGSEGNTGSGCFALYVGHDGWVRFLTRGSQTHLLSGTQHEVEWLGHPLELELGGVRHPVFWLPAVPSSVRVFAPAGTYIQGEVVHIMAQETTVPAGYLHALTV